MFFHFFLGLAMNLAITFCMPVVGIIGLCGFYKKNGMTLMTIIKHVIRIRKQGAFTYRTRTLNTYRELEEIYYEEQQHKGKSA